MQVWNTTNVSQVFIHVPSVPAAGKTLTMRYGDPALSAVSDCYSFPATRFICDVGESGKWFPSYSCIYSGSSCVTSRDGDVSFHITGHSAGVGARYAFDHSANFTGSHELGAIVQFITSAPTNWAGLAFQSDATGGTSGYHMATAHWADTGTNDYAFQYRSPGGSATSTSQSHSSPKHWWDQPRLLNVTVHGTYANSYMEGMHAGNQSWIGSTYNRVGVSASHRAGVGSDTQYIDFDNLYVRAIPAWGDRSLSLSSETVLPQQPAAPSGLAVTNETSSLLLNWSAPSSSPWPLGYNVTRTNATTSVVYALGNVTGWRDSNVSQGHTYNYTVRAWNAQGDSAASSARAGTTAVANLTGHTFFSGNVLTWSAPTHGPAGLQGYNVYKDGALVAGNLAVTTYTDASFTNRATYEVRWNATSAEGPGSSRVVGVLRAPVFDDDGGAIYGGRTSSDGTTTGGRAELAAELGIAPLALDVLYGMFFVVGLSITGFGVGRTAGAEVPGAVVGAVGGIFLSLGFGFFPAWLVAFVGVIGVAAFLLFRGRN